MFSMPPPNVVDPESQRTAGTIVWTPPPFSARAPWCGGDLQTCRNFILRRMRGHVGVDLSAYTESRLVLPLSDGSGDRLSAALNLPLGNLPTNPLAILVHGMSGSEDSSYMMRTALGLLRRGHPVLRLNLRGTGESKATCRREYHAGASDDLRDVLAAVDPALAIHGVILVGYSLGGNIVLKLAGEGGLPASVRAVISVSAPIDLAEADRRMHAKRNRFYHDQLLLRLKRDTLRLGADIASGERRAAESARTIRDFNDRFVAPRNNFLGADDYYRRTAAFSFLPGIAVPALLIHAADDPWIPTDAYRRVAWRDNPCLHSQITRSGGHVGFHVRGDGLPWHDQAISTFLDAVT